MHMHRQLSSHGLRARLQTKHAVPFILSVGGGPAGSAPPTSPDALLPVVPANFHSMSDVEKDFAVRCYEFVRVGSPAPPSTACVDALHTMTAPRLCCSTDPVDIETAWRPFFDIVMLPDGGVCLGWLRNHALDTCWIRCAHEYIYDVWTREPHALFSLRRMQLFEGTRSLMPRRSRTLNVFRGRANVSAAEVEDDFKFLLRLELYRTRRTATLEERVRNLTFTKRVTQRSVREVMDHTAQRTLPLPTGTVAALLQTLLFARALYGTSDNEAMPQRLRLTATRACQLVGDSYAAAPLSWAAALLGGGSGGAAALHAPTAAATVGGETAEALQSLLREVLGASHTRRGAVLCDHVTRFIEPLRSALLAEDDHAMVALRPDGFALPAQKSEAAAAAASTQAALADLPVSSLGVFSFLDGREDAYFTAALGGEVKDATPPPPAVRVEPSGEQLCWVPGLGLDFRGYLCVMLTHVALLCTQLRLHRRHCGSAEVVAALKLVDDTQRILTLSLLRRCCFKPADYNMWSYHSVLTHLIASTLQPSVSVTLLHLSDITTSTEDSSEKDSSPLNDRLVRGLLFLFPTLELSCLHGGSVAEFIAAISTGTHDVRGFLECPHCPAEAGGGSQTTAPPASVAKMRVPQRLIASLTAQLTGRTTAVVCVVQSSFSVKDVFLMEELPSHLRHIIVFQ